MDFQDLYDYLVDKNSVESAQAGGKIASGISVRQHIDEFNKRLKYEPLPNALPILPEFSNLQSLRTSQRALRVLGMTKDSKDTKSQHAVSFRSALHDAANRGDQRLEESPLVQAYVASEDEQAARHASKTSIIEARKVRWILIYGVLQTLISINRTSEEVKDVESCNYPLCCATAGTPPWARPNRSQDRFATSIDGKVLPERFANLVLPERRSVVNIAMHQNDANAETFKHSSQSTARTQSSLSDGSEAPTIPRRKSLGRLRAANAHLTRAPVPKLGHARFTSDPTPRHTSHVFNDFRLPETTNIISRTQENRASRPRSSMIAQPSMPCIRELGAADLPVTPSMATKQWHFNSAPPSPSSRSTDRSAATPSLGDETASSHTRSSLEYDSDSSRFDGESDNSSLSQGHLSPIHNKDAAFATDAEFVPLTGSFHFGFEHQMTADFLNDLTHDFSLATAL